MVSQAWARAALTPAASSTGSNAQDAAGHLLPHTTITAGKQTAYQFLTRLKMSTLLIIRHLMLHVLKQHTLETQPGQLNELKSRCGSVTSCQVCCPTRLKYRQLKLQAQILKHAFRVGHSVGSAPGCSCDPRANSQISTACKLPQPPLPATPSPQGTVPGTVQSAPGVTNQYRLNSQATRNES
jgi:hypothetical protein